MIAPRRVKLCGEESPGSKRQEIRRKPEPETPSNGVKGWLEQQ